jgi:hypothetical protein
MNMLKIVDTLNFFATVMSEYGANRADDAQVPAFRSQPIFPAVFYILCSGYFAQPGEATPAAKSVNLSLSSVKADFNHIGVKTTRIRAIVAAHNGPIFALFRLKQGLPQADDSRQGPVSLSRGLCILGLKREVRKDVFPVSPV